jgi:hypothetical protein
MSTEETSQDSNKSVTKQAGEMVDDIASEIKHEVHSIRSAKKPVDPTQSDVVVRKHVTGISISFFLLIALFLLAALVGIALFTHHQKAAPPAQHLGSMHGVGSARLAQRIIAA